MASAKEHLAAEVHERIASHQDAQAEHHDSRAESHTEHAKVHKEAHESTGMAHHLKSAQLHEKDAQIHKADAAHHREQATLHRAAAADCRKATDTDDLTKRDSLEEAVRGVLLKMFGDTLQPSRVSVVAPNRPGLTRVPRGGEQPVPATPNVPMEFMKLVSVDDQAEEPNVR